MIVYLDASAMVKRYVAEAGTREVAALVEAAESVGTVVISRAETAAALAKAVRMQVVTLKTATAALKTMERDWVDLVRVQLSEVLVARAAALAWNHGLRGYDAVQLAAALFWQEALGEAVVLATYDRQLWEAAGAVGMKGWPNEVV